MRGRDLSTSSFRQQGRKRLRDCDATLGDAEVILSDGGNCVLQLIGLTQFVIIPRHP